MTTVLLVQLPQLVWWSQIFRNSDKTDKFALYRHSPQFIYINRVPAQPRSPDLNGLWPQTIICLFLVRFGCTRLIDECFGPYGISIQEDARFVKMSIHISPNWIIACSQTKHAHLSRTQSMTVGVDHLPGWSIGCYKQFVF